jgi:hypothetical protein
MAVDRDRQSADCSVSRRGGLHAIVVRDRERHRISACPSIGVRRCCADSGGITAKVPGVGD